MKEKTNIPDTEEILMRYCDGTATDEEIRNIENWMEESEENRRMAKQVYTLLLAADTRRVLDEVDTEHALRQVKKRMEKEKKSIGLWRWMQRLAVVLLIPLVVSVFVLYERTENPVQMLEVRTSPGMTASFRLPDSTLVCLNSGSVLCYPSAFTGETREISLNGEAYFEVAKDARKRFVVSAPQGTRIEVLGTHFNLEAFEQADKIVTTLTEGSVGFVYRKADGVRRLIMRPGQKAVYDRRREDMRLYATDGVSELSWKDGKIIFNNTPFDVALHMLEKRYNVDFTVTNPRFSEYAFTGTFVNQHVEQILEYFKISSHIRWRYIDDSSIKQERSRIELY